ncbi:MAG: adenylate/guanylate cyclase domain-containing protein [Alphaproteobacteria bacterium]|nr:adenylate/guanylate cyclase domain-containing protein [Alphaproteobacteria bacterium]
MSDLKERLRFAEREADLESALIRCGIFALLAVAGFLAIQDRGMHLHVLADVGLYGIAAITSLVLAWRRVYHRTIPFIFATFDVVLIVVHVGSLARLMGAGDHFFALPAGTLVLVVMIHASMRYQPVLIGYIAISFIVISGLWPHLPEPYGIPERSVGSSDHMMGMAGMPMGASGIYALDVFPPLAVGMAACILIFGTRKNRRLLLNSIDLAVSTARLSRFFSPKVAEQLAAGGGALPGRRQDVSVLFIDIKGFTTLAEKMGPIELGGFLSEFRERVTAPVFAHGGTVDKFVGDAVLIVFASAEESARYAERAIRCGREILEAVQHWSSEREAAGQSPVEVGIGGHFGAAFVGVVGRGRLLEYTVIGDSVNIAERLERLTRDVDFPFVVSDAMLRAAKAGAGPDADADADAWSPLQPVVLKGRSGTTHPYGMRLVSAVA